MSYRHIVVNKNKNYRVYTVQIAYSDIDSHDDKVGFEEPEVWDIDIPARSNIEAINSAMTIVHITRAETMTDWHTDHPELVAKGEPFTWEDLRDAYIKTKQLFPEWMLIEPTSIQCTLKDDVDKLKDMTIKNLDKMVSGIADEAEDFLKDNNE